VLGLFRLWWVPAGNGPDRGAYVRYPTDQLLEIVAIESHRVGAVVIGEDLGTVPPGVRSELRRRKLLSTRLALFERVQPSRYPRQSFAGVTTHDLPTIAGILSGADLDDQRAAGVTPDPAALALLRGRLLGAAGAGWLEDAGDLGVALHRRLAASPAAMVAATLEDALGVDRRPNLPGTTATQRDNWSRALPLPLERLASEDRVSRVVKALRRPALSGRARSRPD
jgi:4-alpha-glucanotransferase